MLSHDDQRIVNNDTNIPGLGMLLDPQAFVANLAELVPCVQWSSARTCYLRYKPGNSCLAGYEIDSDRGPVQMHATAYSMDLTDKLGKTKDMPSVDGPSGPGVIIDQQNGISICIFPNDRRLRALRRITDLSYLNVMLKRMAPECKFDDVELNQLVYKPQRRYVGQIVASGIPRASLKLYTKADYADIVTRAGAFSSGDSYRAPRVLGVSARHQAIAYEWLPGTPLVESISNAPLAEVTTWVEKTGLALAELHSQSVQLHDHWSISDDVAEIQELAVFIKYLLPGIQGDLDEIIDHLTDRLDSLEPVLCPTHGDFYPKQVLIHQDHVGFIDFDEIKRAHPARDLANFTAHLRRWSLRGQMATERVEPLSQALLAGYNAGANPAGDISESIRVYEAVSLLKLAPHCFRHREPAWPSRIEAIVRQVALLLNGNTSKQTDTNSERLPNKPLLKVIDPVNARADAAMPFLVDACDPGRAAVALRLLSKPVAGQGKSIESVSVRIARHKPGRRCLIEYELELRDAQGHQHTAAILGKARAKGVDLKTVKLMNDLYENGFDRCAADNVSVPQPLGVLPSFSMWCQEKVAGLSSFEALAGSDGPELARRVSVAIYKLHKSPIKVGRRHKMKDELEILDQRLTNMADQETQNRSRLEQIYDGCVRIGDELQESHEALIHRDFYPDHVLVNGPNLSLIDLDLACMGNPALDVGNFIAHMIEWGLRITGNLNHMAVSAQSFEEGYTQLAGDDVRLGIQTYTTLSLVRLLEISTRFLDRQHTTETLLEICEERLFGQSAANQCLATDLVAGGR